MKRPPTLAEVIGPERFRALVLAEREQDERVARRQPLYASDMSKKLLLREVKKHGTTGYAYGCKCDVCRTAAVNYVRKRRAEASGGIDRRRKPPVDPNPEVTGHGTESGYLAGCRGACCREASAQARGKRRARARAKG